jgi:hypothetical protein
MIRYRLQCRHGHGFDAWFRDSAAYDSLRAAGHVACTICGATDVEKALMTPAVATRERETQPTLSAPPESEAQRALAELRRRIEENADYVGDRFADEARRIHDGDAESRAIWGEATREEARSLLEDGVPVAPLPWMRRRDD